MAFVLWISGSPAFADTDLKIELGSRRLSEADVRKAIEVFRGACRPLGGTYWQDLKEITATTFDEYAPHRVANGWRTTIHLSAKIPEKPERIPMFASAREISMHGQTLHYDIGGGIAPGFFAGKRSAKWICSMHQTLDNGDDAFVPVPALGFLP